MDGGSHRNNLLSYRCILNANIHYLSRNLFALRCTQSEVTMQRININVHLNATAYEIIFKAFME